MKKKYYILFLLIVLGVCVSAVKAVTISERLKGKILLQVEQNGEAWYVHPISGERYYMGRPTDAFNIMRQLGIGIKNSDLEKIPVAEESFTGLDSDNDGLSDAIESSFGTDKQRADSDNDGYSDKTEIISGNNPLGAGKMKIDINFANKLKGEIFLQVERGGEAWYVNPENSMRYFLGRPMDAFKIMRELGLGISNNNLDKIEINKNNAPNGRLIDFSTAEKSLVDIEKARVGCNLDVYLQKIFFPKDFDKVLANLTPYKNFADFKKSYGEMHGVGMSAKVHSIKFIEKQAVDDSHIKFNYDIGYEDNSGQVYLTGRPTIVYLVKQNSQWLIDYEQQSKVDLEMALKASRDAKRISDIRQIQTALELYYEDNNNYPDSIYPKMSKGNNIYLYITPFSPDPNSGKDGNEYDYKKTNNGSSYNLTYSLEDDTGIIGAGSNTATPDKLTQKEVKNNFPEDKIFKKCQ